MKLKISIPLLIIVFLCSGCVVFRNASEQAVDAITDNETPSDTSDQEGSLEVKAEEALTNFFKRLNDGKYDQAAILYGGSYEMLQGYNPDLEADDYAGLLKAGCEMNGLVCLEVLNILSVKTSSEGVFSFEIELANPDGSLFELGPCCGATEEEMPPQSSFAVEVVCQENGTCLVIDLPPYMP